MDTSNWIFLSVYVDPDVDQVLRAHAAGENVSKGAMFRRYVIAGIARVDDGGKLVRACDDARLCMRAVYLPPDLYGRVSELRFTFRIGRTEVIRQLLRLGMDALGHRIAVKARDGGSI